MFQYLESQPAIPAMPTAYGAPDYVCVCARVPYPLDVGEAVPSGWVEASALGQGGPFGLLFGADRNQTGSGAKPSGAAINISPHTTVDACAPCAVHRAHAVRGPPACCAAGATPVGADQYPNILLIGNT